ncbi:MAG: hypothetical protein F6K22_22130 [Okeania sp. SIO2F4]|uniref:hypothetical protein n=1 Tax=Okeania sp. SIO2F4 TaxID=2607790 RepID=UPI00142CB07C|nr:hypothetical protein [Okeania sp. SIO2F4]NES05279.1 hypothetical protein [Okeania sp. SIO2F4]
MYLINELARKLKEEYLILENACLNFNMDANNWVDLGEEIHNGRSEMNNLQQNYLENDNIYFR